MKVLITLYVEIEMPAKTPYGTALDGARTAGARMIDTINRHWDHVATARVANVQAMAESYHPTESGEIQANAERINV